MSFRSDRASVLSWELAFRPTPKIPAFFKALVTMSCPVGMLFQVRRKLAGVLALRTNRLIVRSGLLCLCRREGFEYSADCHWCRRGSDHRNFDRLGLFNNRSCAGCFKRGFNYIRSWI